MRGEERKMKEKDKLFGKPPLRRATPTIGATIRIHYENHRTPLCGSDRSLHSYVSFVSHRVVGTGALEIV